MKKGSKGENQVIYKGQEIYLQVIHHKKYKAPARTRPPRDRALESELDRSIKEAQDLLKKKNKTLYIYIIINFHEEVDIFVCIFSFCVSVSAADINILNYKGQL